MRCNFTSRMKTPQACTFADGWQIDKIRVPFGFPAAMPFNPHASIRLIMPFRGTGLVQARGCNVERTGSGEEKGAECRCAREGSRPKRGRKGVVGQRGREGFGVLNHRAGARLPPVYCRIKRSDCYVMDHLYASTLNSALRSSLSLSLSLSLFLEATEIYIGPKTALAPVRTRTRNCPAVRRPSRKFPKFVCAWRAMVMASNFYWISAAFSVGRMCFAA